MTVGVVNLPIQYTLNGSTTVFAVPFYFLDDTHLKVSVVADDVETPLVLGTDFTVSGADNESGGSLTTLATWSAGTLVINRNLPYEQETAYPPNTAFPSSSHERALDYLTMCVQQLAAAIGTTLRLPPQAIGANGILPLPAANELLAWNDAGSGLVNVAAPNASAGTYAPDFTGAIATRLIADKLNEAPSTADFGCAGDGITDDTTAFQAAINSGIGTLRVVGTVLVKSTVTLKSDCYLCLPTGASVKWGGAAGGTVFASPAASVLTRAGVICEGGYIDVSGANVGIYLHSHQCCQFKWESVDTTNNGSLTVIKNIADSTTSTGAIYGSANTARNVWHRIYHSGTHGTLLYLGASGSNINTIGTYHEIRTDANSNTYGLQFAGSCDTHSFGTVTIALGSGATGIMTPDTQNCYGLTFKHVAISCLGTSAGRTLVHVGYKHRWLRIDFLEADTANNDEANAITADASAQSYYIQVSSPVGTWPAGTNVYSLGHFNNGVPQAYTITLADQIAAPPFPIPPHGAIIAFTCSTTGYSGIFRCYSGASPACASLAGDTANIVFGEGAMAAGGGTAGKLNINANNDGNLWISNRSGSTLTLTFKVLAGLP